MQGMVDGWVMDQDNELLFWVPVEHRKDVYVCTAVKSGD